MSPHHPHPHPLCLWRKKRSHLIILHPQNHDWMTWNLCKIFSRMMTFWNRSWRACPLAFLLNASIHLASKLSTAHLSLLSLYQEAKPLSSTQAPLHCHLQLAKATNRPHLVYLPHTRIPITDTVLHTLLLPIKLPTASALHLWVVEVRGWITRVPHLPLFVAQHRTEPAPPWKACVSTVPNQDLQSDTSRSLCPVAPNHLYLR